MTTIKTGAHKPSNINEQLKYNRAIEAVVSYCFDLNSKRDNFPLFEYKVIFDCGRASIKSSGNISC
jgi:hypothetical protein